MKTNVTGKHLNTYFIVTCMYMTGTGMALQYINIFMTDHLMIGAAMVSTVLLIAKIMDLVISMMAGGVVKKVRFKNNQYLSWFKIIRWILLIGFGTAFFNSNLFHLPESIRALLVAIGYITFGTGMSFLMIALSGAMQLMSGSDTKIRARFTARNAQGSALAQIIVAASVIPLLNFFAPLVGESNSYFAVCMTLHMASFIASFAMVALLKPFDTQGAASSDLPQQKVTVGDMVKSVLTNSQLLVIIVAFLMFYSAQSVLNTIQAYYFTYVVNDFDFMATSLTIKTGFAFVAAMFVPKISAKLGKKHSLSLGLAIAGISMLSISFVGGMSKYMFTLCTCLFTAAMYLFTSFGVNYFIDCGEYGYYKTGQDNRVIAMSMYNIPMKIGFMVGGSLGGYGLAFIGYHAGMAATAEFIDKFLILLGAAPAVLLFIGVAAAHFGYKITDEDAAMYANANQHGNPSHT